MDMEYITRDNLTLTHIQRRSFVAVQWGRRKHAHILFNDFAECTKTITMFPAINLLNSFDSMSRTNLWMYWIIPGLG
jgi:hypothetical protein